MNWQHLKTFLWLRWRLGANQLRRAGAVNFVVLVILIMFGITIAVTMTRPATPHVDLPATALLEKDGKTQVWIVDPASHTVALRDVVLLGRDEDSIAVKSGIAAGERVVTVGVHSLTPGQRVKIAGEQQ